MSTKALVLDANILIRAVLGKRVRELILAHAQTTQFFAPDVAYADARKYLPELLRKLLWNWGSYVDKRPCFTLPGIRWRSQAVAKLSGVMRQQGFRVQQLYRIKGVLLKRQTHDSNTSCNDWALIMRTTQC